MELIVIPAILAFIVTCIKFIIDGIFCNQDVKNKVKLFFLLWCVWTVNLAAIGEFTCKLMGI